VLTVSARRKGSGVGVALLGMSAAAAIGAFAFVVLPKFFPADRHSVSPITVDLFLPDHKLAASPRPGKPGQLAASAKHHGLAALSNSSQAKVGADGDTSAGAKTVAASGHS